MTHATTDLPQKDLPDYAVATFAEADLPEALSRVLDDIGFTTPTEVQQHTLLPALEGNDLMVSAQTGSGKTLAFLLPCLAHLVREQAPEALDALTKVGKRAARGAQPKPSVLVVCPTRELVQQVSKDAIKLVKHIKGARVASVIGGMPYGKQIAMLQGAQVLVATPGRLLDLEAQGKVSLRHVARLVLDEADRMLDMGFSEDLEKIAHLCKARQQTLLFSATFADNIMGLATKFMDSPTRIKLAHKQHNHSDITQSLCWADDDSHKEAILHHWLGDESLDQAVIFVSTQRETQKLADHLEHKGYSAVAMHGAMPQQARMRRLKSLRSGRSRILVATDVAARGLDVPSISHVFNYGLPMRHEDYVHRIGRTGRAGRKGSAITLATRQEHGKVRALQRFLARNIDEHEIEGLEPKPFTPEKKRGKSRKRKSNASKPAGYTKRHGAGGGSGGSAYPKRKAGRYGNHENGDANKGGISKNGGRNGNVRNGKARNSNRYNGGEYRDGGDYGSSNHNDGGYRGNGKSKGREHFARGEGGHAKREGGKYAKHTDRKQNNSQDRANSRFKKGGAGKPYRGKSGRQMGDGYYGDNTFERNPNGGAKASKSGKRFAGANKGGYAKKGSYAKKGGAFKGGGFKGNGFKSGAKTDNRPDNFGNR